MAFDAFFLIDFGHCVVAMFVVNAFGHIFVAIKAQVIRQITGKGVALNTGAYPLKPGMQRGQITRAYKFVKVLSGNTRPRKEGKPENRNDYIQPPQALPPFSVQLSGKQYINVW